MTRCKDHTCVPVMISNKVGTQGLPDVLFQTDDKPLCTDVSGRMCIVYSPLVIVNGGVRSRDIAQLAAHSAYNYPSE